jgi:methionyl aminopeptidase
MGIIIKSEREIAIMRQAGRIVATVLGILCRQVRVGMKTKELDTIAETEVERLGAKPSFKGYRGFPASLCVSVNDEIVHGIPGERILRDGDIVSLDLGASFMGFQGDSALTIGVGKISPQAQELIKATEGMLAAGIAVARAGTGGYFSYYAKLCRKKGILRGA